MDATGNGPVQPYTVAQAPDLTKIAIRNGGRFPAEQVVRTVDGQFDSPSPNSRHMPIRGYNLFTGEGDDEAAHQQVLDMEHRIVKYVGPSKSAHHRSELGGEHKQSYVSPCGSSRFN
jgi:hypothetical protein